jgi:hypothetical protein
MEKIGGDGNVSLLGETPGDTTDVVIEPKRFHDHNHSAMSSGSVWQMLYSRHGSIGSFNVDNLLDGTHLSSSREFGLSWNLADTSPQPGLQLLGSCAFVFASA